MPQPFRDSNIPLIRGSQKLCYKSLIDWFTEINLVLPAFFSFLVKNYLNVLVISRER